VDISTERFAITEGEFVEGTREGLARFHARRIPRSVTMGLIFLAGGIVVDATSKSRTVLLSLGVILIGFGLGTIFRVPLAVRRAPPQVWKGEPLVRQSRVITFRDDSIESAGELQTTITPWTSLSKMQVHADLLLFFLASGRLWAVVPQRAFKTPDDETAVHSYASQKLQITKSPDPARF
jgi:hypothetical protein